MDLSKIKINCPCCEKHLGDLDSLDFLFFSKQLKEYVVNKNRISRKIFCSQECVDNYKKQFAIDYKGVTMYRIEQNGEIKYMPYWVSHYYFLTKEECYQRIIAKHISVPI